MLKAEAATVPPPIRLADSLPKQFLASLAEKEPQSQQHIRLDRQAAIRHSKQFLVYLSSLSPKVLAPVL